MASLYQFFTLLLMSLQTGSAKINGGPRGRFVGSPASGVHGLHTHVSARHAYYSYHPPSHITFMCRFCSQKTFYPVYHSAPPTYVYKFRESNSRYAVLLSGLSLYNLGRCCGHQASYENMYTARAEERCSLQVIDKNGFEETVFPCFMMSSFMERSNNSKLFETLSLKTEGNRNVTPTEESITVDIVSANIDVKSYLSSNDSELVVASDQECVIWHNMTLNKEKHNVPCSLLKQYAETMKPSGVPVYIWMPILLTIIVGIYVCGYCCCRRKKDGKEDLPLNQNSVYRYCSSYY